MEVTEVRLRKMKIKVGYFAGPGSRKKERVQEKEREGIVERKRGYRRKKERV
jgi:hypothetical protein